MKKWYRIKDETRGEMIDLNEVDQVTDEKFEAPDTRFLVTIGFKSGRAAGVVMSAEQLDAFRQALITLRTS